MCSLPSQRQKTRRKIAFTVKGTESLDMPTIIFALSVCFLLHFHFLASLSFHSLFLSFSLSLSLSFTFPLHFTPRNFLPYPSPTFPTPSLPSSVEPVGQGGVATMGRFGAGPLMVRAPRSTSWTMYNLRRSEQWSADGGGSTKSIKALDTQAQVVVRVCCGWCSAVLSGTVWRCLEIG